MDSEPYLSFFQTFLSIHLNPVTPGILTGFAIIFILLILSALISGSEAAYFSIQPFELEKLKEMKTTTSLKTISLLSKPEKLLATIHISNNFINVGIVIVSTFITTSLFDFQQDPLIAFMIQLAVVTFLLLVFGEIVPKLLANQNALKISMLMATPLTFLDRLFMPVSRLLIFSSRILQRKISTGNQNLSMVDLSDALDLTTGFVQEDKKILRSIVNFSNIEVNEIMKPRLDIVAVEKNTKLEELVRVINESGYSRIPVYSETFDNISGILYVKDLLPHIDRDNDFQWHSLIRSAYYVPGSKKINVLLQEFREKKIHLAIVVDEYGGTEGIVTLEDIMEEIVGEITDESDEVESYYTRIDEKNYVFDAKTLLNDFYKTLQLQEDVFESIRGDADTLAGLVLELLGDLPNQNEVIKIDPFTFTILSVDNRRIKKIKVSFDRPIS